MGLVQVPGEARDAFLSLSSAELLQLVVTCARGTEVALTHELKALGAAQSSHEGRGAVVLSGDWALVARINVSSRIAQKVLVQLAAFSAKDEPQMMDELSRIPFEDHLDERSTFACEAHLVDAPWDHTLFASQRVKDAIVDRMRAKKKGRPDVDVKQPRVRFVLYWHRSSATISLDATGVPLFKRGYRKEQGVAPMKETLAAAILAIAAADTRRPFIDPCCGSGTIAIEQALRALDRAPSIGRHFAFERWRTSDDAMRNAAALAREEAKAKAKKKLDAPIRLSDWHPKAIAACEANLEAAGLTSVLQVERIDARKVLSPGDRPVVVSNLPFGERLAGENKLQLEGFYRTLGEHLGSWPGARVCLYSAQERAEDLLGLSRLAGRPRRWPLASGALAATLLRWDVPERSRDDDDQPRRDDQQAG